MKMSIATIAITLAYLVSFVIANHLNAMGATMTSDTDPDQATTSDSLLGAVSNKVNAKDNNILITKSNILISPSDRVQLARTIKEMMSNSPEAGPARTMTTEDLFGLLTRIATNPTVLSNAAGIISAARSGNTGALAGHVVGLLGAAVPAAVPVVAPTAAPLPVLAPVVAPVNILAPAVPIAPIYASSPMSPPVAPAAATTST